MVCGAAVLVSGRSVADEGFSEVGEEVMAVWGTETAAQRDLEERHRRSCEREIERIRETAPEHHKPDIDRLWELVREASTS